MSQSKLSVVSSLTPYLFSADTDRYLNRYEASQRQKEYRDQAIEHRKYLDSFDSTYYLRKLNNPPNRVGLPLLEDKATGFSNPEEVKALTISIKNTGDLPSTNVRVNLLFRTYGTKNFYPKNPFPSELIEREIFSEDPISISVPYMGANDQRTFIIYDLHGQFRETELILLSIKSNGFTYIKNNFLKTFFRSDSEIILNHYQMSIFELLNLTEENKKIIYGIESAENTGNKGNVE